MKLSRTKNRTAALTLVELLVVIFVLVLLGAFILPQLARRNARGSRIDCVNNLKQVGLSFLLWAGDNSGKFPMQVSVTNGGTMELVGSGLVYPHFRAMSNELSTPKVLGCPEDTKAMNEMRKVLAAHALARGTNRGYSPPFFPTDFPVSYFVSVDADTNQPAMLLSGDANLAVGRKPAKPGLISLWTNSPVAWAKPLRPYHGKGGNIVQVDGHVDQLTTPGFQQALKNSGAATNRLAVP